MSNIRKASLFQDLSGVLRGLYIVKQNANMLTRQRPPLGNGLRTLTQAQRDSFAAQRKMEEYENQIQQEEKEQMEKMVQQHNQAMTQENIQKEEEAKTHIQKSVQKAKKEEAKLEKQLEEELGESTFGKGDHQKETVYSDDVPFFMKQDRPKFSTQERYVPSSPASRALHFGMLGVRLFGGTMAEAIKQKVSGKEGIAADQEGVAKYALNQKNADLLADNFKKMRGAALKIGQMLSTSEESALPPIIREAMEKARSEADIMPLKQVTKNLIREYGQEWQNNFQEINLYPFAAASIGQVHEAILRDGKRVALKMQYTGIANSIDSDLNNFQRLSDVLGIFPRGLYIDEAIKVARKELHWECDYTREAKYQIAYRKHLLRYPKNFYCPEVVEHLSTKSLLCSEFVDGVEIDTFMHSPQKTRDRIGELLISLCFKELFEFKMMQTDPNPANYLFDEKTWKMNLLDLGAGRDFEENFLDNYMQVVWGAYKDDRDAILNHSHNIGFLTGDENKEMLNAHYKGTMIVGEPFRTKAGELYDFGAAGLTEKVQDILPTMAKHRLTPPPEEIYSLHKKIIGTYLMCIKLRSRVPAKEILEETKQNWIDMHGDAFYQKTSVF